MKKILFSFAFAISVYPIFAQSKVHITSPDGRIAFIFSVINGKPSYTVSHGKQVAIDNSEFGLAISGKVFTDNVRLLTPVNRRGVEEYELTVGKAKKVKDEYKEVTLPLENKSLQAHVNIIVRIFNDAVAFRYEFKDYKGQDSLRLNDERTTFNLPTGTTARALPLPSYTSSHEGYYTTSKISQLREGELLDTPALFETPGGIFLGITEAALLDYAGMYLSREGGTLRSKLSPRVDDPTLKVKAAFPHNSPWRVVLLSDRVGALIESNVITSLNAPSIADISWIKPGKTTFPWWNGNVVPDTLNAPGNNFITQKYYIDFCARNHIEYHSVVEYGLHQWYMDDGVGFQPGPHSDVTTPVPGLDMKEVCDYAHSKGVGVRVWVQWAALYPKIDQAFTNFEKWGLSGMMIDFMDRDDQQMVNIQTEMLQKAAAHHLHVQFHGAYKPTGLHRTYPNEFTREGTLNYEINKWDEKGLPPDHDLMIPFTRMLAGSTDYHLGGFRAIGDRYYRQYTRPVMRGTRCHMLAMYVVLENYQGMVCDYPDAYEGQPGFEFIQSVPTVWDETRVPDGRPGEYIAVARRKGSDWFVGAITNHEKREISIALDFLGDGTYEVTTFSDADDVSINANHLAKNTRRMSRGDSLTIGMAGGGGMSAQIRKINP